MGREVKYEFIDRQVYVRASGSLWDMLLCKYLHIHDWRYWRMAKSFENAFPYDRCVERHCVRCKLTQTAQESTPGSSERQDWRGRI